MSIIEKWASNMEIPFVIAGPCSAESEEQMIETARLLDKKKVHAFRAGAWKPRTKPNCFEGVGEVGLKWLKKVKDETGFKICTEIANAHHAELALKYELDYLWIGARSTVNPFTVQEIAEALKGTEKMVFVKNPVNPDLDLWIGAFERLYAMDVKHLGAIHRGFSTYKKKKYRNEPHWQIALDFKDYMPEIPLLCDPSHICGNREGILGVSQQALNFRYNGLMIETHWRPDNAKSDASQQITPHKLSQILEQIEVRKVDDEDVMYNALLANMRNDIDETDSQILETIAHRMQISLKIGELKRTHNVALFQPERWKIIKQKAVEKGMQLGLSEAFIDKLLRAIHQESLLQQDHIMNENQVAIK